jgi:putative inorganic carbon (HCO3(-)) transporter
VESRRENPEIATPMHAAWWPVAAYLVLVPWTAELALGLYGYDYARIVEVLVCSGCSVAICWWLWQQPARTSTPAIGRSAWAAALLVLALACVALAPRTYQALQEWALAIGLVAVAATVAWTYPPGAKTPLAQAIIVATLLQSVAALPLLVLGAFHGVVPDFEHLGTGYDNRRFFNHVQTVSLTLTAMALHGLDPSRRGWIAAAWAGLVGGFSLLLLCGGRGTLAGIACAVAVSALWMRRDWWACTRPLVQGAIGGSALYLLVFVLLPLQMDLAGSSGITQRALDSGNARVYLWDLALRYINESPWFGIGPMHYAHRPNLKAAHPHNIYLQVAAEWGLPMLALLLAGLAAAFRQLFKALARTTARSDRLTGGSLVIACLAILVDALVSGNFVLPVSQVWIAVCAGMTVRWAGAAGGMQAPSQPAAGVRWRYLWIAVLATAAGFLLASLIRDLDQFETIIQQSKALSISDRLKPRFWGNGWF